MEHLRALLGSGDPGGGEAGLPLGVLFSRCQTVYAQQDQLVTSRDPDLIDSALTLLARTQSAVESAGIFSANEDADDLATADVKFLLVPFYIGSLLSAAPVTPGASGSAAVARLSAVQRALPALGTFLHRCEQYDMLGVLGRNAMDAASSGAAPDPAAKRTFKVEKFKREKALGAALAGLEARRAAAAAQEREDEAAAAGAAPGITRGGVDGVAVAGAAAAAAAAAAGGGAGAGAGSAIVAAASRGAGAGGGSGGALDEEDERQLWKWRVELCVLRALDMQASLKQEDEMLQHVTAREAAAPGPSGSGRPGGAGAAADSNGPSEAERAMLMEKLRGICRDLDGGRREQMKRDVFKPSHILPTLTVEEAGEIEGREAMEREARQAKAEAKEAARRAALDSDEEDEEDKRKARAWDDYRDANPRGAGNSKLRPCG
ncbi:hypothetical protein HYH02_001025 [Chlamydomonas schloesseri]|uniref:TAP42-like protein n=1 Tax=Chlamydomonas schloesseri TaxID=2026947 RepID=A0A835WV33_9CHLO|nr:hypothetical protein HYH02_001025 [Chlamydomonas schloesseri]|eukprot:KAG2453979.1 hypothetical protein HYH02_001025 [Chlamydomonas schloesseri]